MKKLLLLVILLTSYSAFAGVTFVDSFDVSSKEQTPTGLAFSANGLKMFVVGSQNDKVHQYSLSTAFDVSTASMVSDFYHSVGISGQGETLPHGLAFNSDGTKMFLVGRTLDDVSEYVLGVGFDVGETSSFNMLIALLSTVKK